MIRVVLVDDEQPALDELAFLLADYDQIEIKAAFTQPSHALEYVLMHDIDCVFTDISMPQIDGFQLAEALMRLRQPPAIVFATAFDEYAIKAFEINAIDYLLKPITKDRLILTLNKLSQYKVGQGTNPGLTHLIHDRYLQKRVSRIPLWRDDRIHLITPASIAYLESRDGGTCLFTDKGDFISTEAMTHYEGILEPYGFFRCHRSFIIRIDAIKEIIPWFNNTYAVRLKGFDTLDIPVSRRNLKDFKTLVNIL